MKQIIILILAMGVVLTISACNTVRGVGQDVKSVGRGVEHASDVR